MDKRVQKRHREGNRKGVQIIMEYAKMKELYKKQWIIRHGQPGNFWENHLMEYYAIQKAYKLLWIIDGSIKSIPAMWRRQRALRVYNYDKNTLYI